MAQSTNQRRLRPLALQPLPPGTVRPTGWLRRQLEIQANGLSGHLDEFWPDIAQSGWIGGEAEGWERGPYWLDGVVPLAYLLGDGILQAKVERWVTYILDHQAADGWFGPVTDSTYGYAYDPWPRFPLLKALTQYAEATGDPRIPGAIERFLRRLAQLLAEAPLRAWGRHRWADLVVTIHWLYDRTGEDWLLELAATCQQQGYDWHAHYANLPVTDRCRPDQRSLDSHVVNNAMGIKADGVWLRQSTSVTEQDATWLAIDALDRHHGQVTGAFTGDEHLAGRNPSQGTELCAVVEYLYSLEVLLSVVGEARLADRLESLVFNCLPATCSPDMWSHQYDQQANQVVCRVAEDRVYTSNLADANIFGLEPNFGCCTANMHQGWPKFATHLWMRTPDGGLAAVAYAPATVRTELPGGRVSIAVATRYPFGDTIRLSVRSTRRQRFPLLLRVPGWTSGATVSVGNAAPVAVAAGGFHRLEQTWAAGVTEVRLRLPMPIQVTRRYQQSVAISRGPLVYSLRIGEDWRHLRGEAPHADYEIEPTTAWNYGLRLDLAQPERSLRFRERPIGAWPFSPAGAPVEAVATGRQLPAWTIEHNAAAPPPASPVRSGQPLEEITLIPYGCTNLRITEFPLLAE